MQLLRLRIQSGAFGFLWWHHLLGCIGDFSRSGRFLLHWEHFLILKRFRRHSSISEFLEKLRFYLRKTLRRGALTVISAWPAKHFLVRFLITMCLTELPFWIFLGKICLLSVRRYSYCWLHIIPMPGLEYDSLMMALSVLFTVCLPLVFNWVRDYNSPLRKTLTPSAFTNTTFRRESLSCKIRLSIFPYALELLVIIYFSNVRLGGAQQLQISVYLLSWHA